MSFIKRHWQVVTISSVSGVLAIIDYISKWGIFDFLWNVILKIIRLVVSLPLHASVVVLTCIVVYLCFNINRLSKYVALGFTDNFSKPPIKKWDYQGDWSVEGNELTVTHSEVGGITKVGHLWTDYVFEFNGVIVNGDIGWIVRAQDPLNYYMIQLTTTLIRPHLRLGLQWILLNERPHNQQISTNQKVHIRNEVRGLGIRIFLNDTEVYDDHTFFAMKTLLPSTHPDGSTFYQLTTLQPNAIIVNSYTSGRVGFRMANNESGRISRCRVRLI